MKKYITEDDFLYCTDNYDNDTSIIQCFLYLSLNQYKPILETSDKWKKEISTADTNYIKRIVKTHHFAFLGRIFTEDKDPMYKMNYIQMYDYINNKKFHYAGMLRLYRVFSIMDFALWHYEHESKFIDKAIYPFCLEYDYTLAFDSGQLSNVFRVFKNIFQNHFFDFMSDSEKEYFNSL